MNIDIENQENFEKKKKIIIICLSVALVFITLIAGLFLIKKNKESRENNNIGEVVNENNENNDDNDHENDGVIVNEGDYFFNKTSCQVITNILLFLVTGVLFFFWENDKLPKEKKSDSPFCGNCNKKNLLCIGGNKISGDSFCEENVYCGIVDKSISINIGFGIFEKSNLFGFASLGFLIFITFLVELSLHFLIGSLSHLFSKDKNKRYSHTLRMFRKKRKQIFFSFSKTKTFFVVFSSLLCGFVIAILARVVGKRLEPCCCGKEIMLGRHILKPCPCRDTGEIIHDHNIYYCLGCCEVEHAIYVLPSENN